MLSSYPHPARDLFLGLDLTKRAVDTLFVVA